MSFHNSLTGTLESGIVELTKPLNGQFPRPWMTNLPNPSQAKLFVVGKNQAKGYPINLVGGQSRYIDALFNRNGQSCRALYDEITGGKSSPTRENIDQLTSKLAEAGVHELLETNVICYSTAMSSDLSKLIHKGGRQRGDEIFRFLLAVIQPSILITHGASTRSHLEKLFGRKLPPLPVGPSAVTKKQIHTSDYNLIVYPLPSLAPPAFNSWKKWSGEYQTKLAADVANELVLPMTK